MAEETGQERTEEATPKRQQEAREKGQIPRSRELNTLAALLVAGGAMLILGGGMMQGIADVMVKGLSVSRADAFNPDMMFLRLEESAIAALMTIAPFLVLMVAVAILAAVALGGWSFSFDAFSFKVDRMDPVKGFGRIFSMRGVLEMVKGLAKFLVVAAVAILYLLNDGEQLLGLGTEPLDRALAHLGSLLGWSFLIVSSAMILVAAIDVPFQLWDHRRQLRMTLQEIKEEFKQTEGSPEVKARQRRIQMEMARRRMMEEVPKADVVVTNPTHFAVALKYDAAKMNAPVVVAKGADLVAAEIRRVAQENSVPILSAPPLARSLYHHTDLDKPIPAGLYRAVAQVLAYVFHLREAPVYQRDEVVSMPDLPIPEDLRRD